MTTGERIKHYRIKKGLSQKKLGEILGVSQQMIGQYENSSKTPKFETLEKIAKALGVSIMDLISFSDRYSIPGKDSAAYDFGTEEYKIHIQINENLEKLNLRGKKEVNKRIEEITHIPKYQNGTRDKE